MGNFNGKGYGDQFHQITLKNGDVWTTNACRIEDFAEKAGLQDIEGYSIVTMTLPQAYSKNDIIDVIYAVKGVIPTGEQMFKELYLKGVLTKHEILSCFNAEKIQLDEPLDQ